jgi:hypothetical protein
VCLPLLLLLLLLKPPALLGDAVSSSFSFSSSFAAPEARGLNP